MCRTEDSELLIVQWPALKPYFGIGHEKSLSCSFSWNLNWIYIRHSYILVFAHLITHLRFETTTVHRLLRKRLRGHRWMPNYIQVESYGSSNMLRLMKYMCPPKPTAKWCPFYKHKEEGAADWSVQGSLLTLYLQSKTYVSGLLKLCSIPTWE